MKKTAGILIALTAVLFCTGCGAGRGNENIAAGMASLEELSYDNALESFEAALAAGEDKRLLYRGEGIAYLGKTMYAEAAEAFETALSLSDGKVDSMDYDINYYLAVAYYKQGDIDRAIQVYDAIIALRENDADAYYLRGSFQIQKGNLEAARADFDKTRALKADDYDRLIDIYCVLADNGYKEVGQEYLQTAMDAGTKNMSNFDKGQICFYLEDYENAKTYLDKARDEGGYQAVLLLGKTYETLGDNNYAISVYNSYLETEEPNAQVLNQLGLCKMRTEDYEGALLAFQTAMNIENNEIMQTLKMNEVIVYEYLGEYRQAATLLQGYLQSYPDDEEAQREYVFLQTR